MLITIKGWRLKVKWKSGTTSYITLKDINNTNPVDIAEYAKANKIDKEPAFAWWVPSAIKCRKLILIKASMRVRNKMKFVIYIPATYNDAVELNPIVPHDVPRRRYK